LKHPAKTLKQRRKYMPKLSNALAASALLVALSAPSFAADLNSSTSQHNSATIQNRSDSSAGVNTRSGTRTQTNDNDRDDMNRSGSLSGSASMNNKSTLDRDRSNDRPQSAQMPKRDQDPKGPGRSTPGHEMQENGSVPGSPGASGYAPGHR
jgi:hypothetical protein